MPRVGFETTIPVFEPLKTCIRSHGHWNQP